MKISSKGRYAVRVMVYIAKNSNNIVSISEISESQNITIKYLEQIISKLVKAKLLLSFRGSQGGYKLARNPEEYKISEILSVTGDMPELAPCLKENKVCPIQKKCTTIGVWDKLSKLMYDYLENITLKDLMT